MRKTPALLGAEQAYNQFVYVFNITQCSIAILSQFRKGINKMDQHNVAETVVVSKAIDEFKKRVSKNPRADFTNRDMSALGKYFKLDEFYNKGKPLDLWTVINVCLMYGFMKGTRSENRRLQKVRRNNQRKRKDVRGNDENK